MKAKIRKGNELVDATVEIIDDELVVNPVEEVFEPMDGDVITCYNGLFEYTSIFSRKGDNNCFGSYCGIVLQTDVFVSEFQWPYYVNPRYATEEEKKRLFDKIEQKGLEWDADKKELRRKRWKPEMYDEYYFPIHNSVYILFSPYEVFWDDSQDDKERLKLDWCFETKEECQEFCNKLNEAIKSVKR